MSCNYVNEVDTSGRSFPFASHQAIMEASRCLFCYDAPCASGCPAGIDIPGFIRDLKYENFTGAARKIREKNALAITCGHICPSERFCEAKCSNAMLVDPIRIRALHRFASDFELQHGIKSVQPKVLKGRKVAVIGSGPAGLACAAELTKLGYAATVFEESPAAGGVLFYGVPTVKLPRLAIQTDVDHIVRMGVDFRLSTRLCGTNALDDLLAQEYSAVFIGIGLGRPSGLGMNSENLKGVYSWKEVLSWFNTGSNPSPDRKIELGRRVVVVGGGNVALDVATSAVKKGAEVHVICLEAFNEMPAFRSELDEALSAGVIVHSRARVLDIKGNTGLQVCGVEGVGIRWQKPDNYSPANAVAIDGNRFTLEADSVVVAIGQSLDKEASPFISALEIKSGYIVIDEKTGATSRKKVFAGGDAVRGGGTVVQSVRDGAVAARGIDSFLTGK